jgi:hypothetical protein
MRFVLTSATFIFKVLNNGVRFYAKKAGTSNPNSRVTFSSNNINDVRRRVASSVYSLIPGISRTLWGYGVLL